MTREIDEWSEEKMAIFSGIDTWIKSPMIIIILLFNLLTRSVDSSTSDKDDRFQSLTASTFEVGRTLDIPIDEPMIQAITKWAMFQKQPESSLRLSGPTSSSRLDTLTDFFFLVMWRVRFLGLRSSVFHNIKAKRRLSRCKNQNETGQSILFCWNRPGLGDFARRDTNTVDPKRRKKNWFGLSTVQWHSLFSTFSHF
jgi:hypothetical protein